MRFRIEGQKGEGKREEGGRVERERERGGGEVKN